MARPSIRLRIARAILGSRAKELIPALMPDGTVRFGPNGQLNNYASKQDRLRANISWCFAANEAIVNPTAAVALKLYRRTKKGDREEVTDHPILSLLDTPNFALTGEQMRQLHFTYMNFVGESYIYMRDGAEPFQPAKGKLPDALDIFPAHKVSFKLGDTFLDSIVKLGQKEYPIWAFVRDLNPDPNNPYGGHSIIAAAAAAIDNDQQMNEWNRRKFANGAEPSLVFTSQETLDDASYERWQKQFQDEHTGIANAGKPLLIEGGDVKQLMVSNKDLDFL